LPEIRLEVCVDEAAGIAAAIAGGADRLELCAALPIGGLTPSPGLMELAAASGLPAYPMIRSRTGPFIYDARDVAVMKADIRAARAHGLTGVVIGANRAGGGLDLGVLSDLVAEAQGLDLTLHRAIDLCADKEEAVEQAVSLGFKRILSSGGALKAPDGVAELDRMFRAARGRLIIMPGSGVSAETLPRLAVLPLVEIHGSCSEPVARDAKGEAFGFLIGAERLTSVGKVAALKVALRAL
jgi:copper homeostasis protein